MESWFGAGRGGFPVNEDAWRPASEPSWCCTSGAGCSAGAAVWLDSLARWGTWPRRNTNHGILNIRGYWIYNGINHDAREVADGAEAGFTVTACAALTAAPPFGKLRRMRKDGHVAGRQAYSCGDCGRRCEPGEAYRRPGPEVKEQALEMYMEGSSLSAIGRVLGYSAPAVLGWVKKGGVPH